MTYIQLMVADVGNKLFFLEKKIETKTSGR